MTLTSYDFHKLTGLRSHNPAIHLRDAYGRALVVKLLGRSYPKKIVRYYLLARNVAFHSQATPKDLAWMARAFLVHVVGATLFANAGQTVNLRWLKAFKDFEAAREVNWGSAYLFYMYFIMYAMSWEVYLQLASH